MTNNNYTVMVVYEVIQFFCPLKVPTRKPLLSSGRRLFDLAVTAVCFELHLVHRSVLLPQARHADVGNGEKPDL
jgi:hypothetical protein